MRKRVKCRCLKCKPGLVVALQITVAKEKLVEGAFWFAMATSAFVLFEPAPFEFFMIASCVLLAVTGSACVTKNLLPLIFAWVLISIAGLAATAGSSLLSASAWHTLISIYLGMLAIAIAAFVAWSPVRRASVIMSGYTTAAALASVIGLAVYLNFLPGLHDQMTKFDRMTGTFKDPNVFSAFLIPAILHLINKIATRPLRQAFWPFFVLTILAAALLLAFSRGAWICLGVAIAVYAYLIVLRSRRRDISLRIIVTGMAGTMVLGGLFFATMNSENMGGLLAERSQLVQTYDYERLEGQKTAVDHAVNNPAGIGARVFYKKRLHDVDVHNVYLSMFLNAGWIGGLCYAGLVLLTLILGLRALLASALVSVEFSCIYASFVAVALEGLIIDTDHWRHFYILLGLMWGFISANPIGQRQNSRFAELGTARQFGSEPALQVRRGAAW